MYAIKKSLYLSVSAIILCGGGGSVANYDIIQNTHTTHISALASAPSYQVASITWLPEYDENEKTWGKYVISKGTGGGHGKGDGCDKKYNLSGCPKNGDCDKCAFAKKYYFKGCKEGYKPKTPGSMSCIEDCTPETCEEGFSVITNRDPRAEYKECDPGCNKSKQYKFLKCEDGYFLEDGKCVACEKTQPEGSCPDGTRFNEGTACENDKGVKVGDCEDCLKTDCKGFFSCDGETQNGEGRRCPCGNKTYYEYCSECNKTETSCPEGYELENGCTRNGTKYYDCVDCLDEETQKNPCKGLYTCRGGGRKGKGESTCSCGSVPYYKECFVVEECKYNHGDVVREDEEKKTGGICYVTTKTNPIFKNGNYIIKSLCTKVDGTEMVAYSSCTGGKDCVGNEGPAKGLVICDGDIGIGKSVECGGNTYYETCNCPYVHGVHIDENGGICYVTTKTNPIFKNGNYIIKSLCTRADGTEMVAYSSCTGGKDCDGNDAPAKGLMQCPFGMAMRNDGGQVVDCGGYSYGTDCLAKCNYEFKEEDCTAQGKTFDRKCHDNDDVWWGECK